VTRVSTNLTETINRHRAALLMTVFVTSVTALSVLGGESLPTAIGTGLGLTLGFPFVWQLEREE
jgi:hypothetical protein